MGGGRHMRRPGLAGKRGSPLLTAFITILNGTGCGTRYPLTEGEHTIGRIDRDLTIPDESISRLHARVICHPPLYEIEDAGSRNGVFINNSKVAHATLEDGNLIVMGNSLLRFNREKNESDESFQFIAEPMQTIEVKNLEMDISLPPGIPLNDSGNGRAEADLAVLYRAGRLINSTLDPSELMARITATVLKEIPAVDFCSIHLLGEDGRSLKCMAHAASDPSKASKPIFSAGIIELVLDQKQAVLTSDALQDTRFAKHGSVLIHGIRSALCVPILHADHIVGVLQAGASGLEKTLTVNDLKLLGAIGLQAGTAFENARLFERLSKDKAALEESHRQLLAAQEGLINSEKLAAVGRLTAGIAHDIRNPLTVILGHAQILKRAMQKAGLTTISDVNAQASAGEIEHGVEHCNRIISHLLQFARQSKPQRIPILVNELLQDVLHFLAHELKKGRATTELHLSDALPSVQADPNQVKQVLINIVINAIQALPGKGAIAFSTLPARRGNVDYAAIRVADNGCGIQPEMRQKIFEPFFTTKPSETGPGGTGLGLSVSYGIIKNHGGDIEVESIPGQGSTFTILLPVQAPAQTTPPGTE